MSASNSCTQVYWKVGQEPASADCAYFCGYILGLVRRHPASPSRWILNRNDVYRARDAVIRPRQPPRLRKQGRFAWAHQVPAYLASPAVGATGYGYYPNVMSHAGRAPTEAEFIQRIDRNLTPGYGVMLLVGGSQNQSQAGHWIAILGRPARGQWRWYDPDPRESPHSDVIAAAVLAGHVHDRVTFYVCH